MQEVFKLGEEEKDGICGEATKGAPTGEASMPCKGKGAGRRKKAEKDRERRSGMRGQATRSTARDRRSVEKESSACPIIESTGALWGRHSE